MGIDFVLDGTCPVKRQLSTEGMIELIKGRNRAAAILKIARHDGNATPPRELLITQVAQTPEGVQEQRKVSVQSLIDAAAPLDGLALHCDGCAARLAREPFTCYGSIRYPIQLRTEQWLMSLLPEDLDCTAAVILQKYVRDFGYDGGSILKLRDNPTFFDDRQGHRRTWKGKGMLRGFSTAFSLTSSQLLQMMFAVGPLQPSHCAMLCLFLGLIPHDSPPEELRNSKTFLRVAFKDYDVPSDVPDLDGFIQFCDALLRSVFTDLPVAIDY